MLLNVYHCYCVFFTQRKDGYMSEKFRVKLSCPDCGSEQFIFSAEPHTIDNVESCASCGRAISKNDVFRHGKDFLVDTLRDRLKGTKFKLK
ncbi:ECs_2282 family putative zinc-binding protein [Klebsiella michiganensis]|uniref:ECs_2282 family putative zinc-binding protein n=1 Tax=Raoultella ornithinolytica TaxID=54291 RepID=UPI003F68F0E1